MLSRAFLSVMSCNNLLQCKNDIGVRLVDAGLVTPDRGLIMHRYDM